MEAANGQVSQEGGHSLLRYAKLCKDVALFWRMTPEWPTTKVRTRIILPAKGTKIPAQFIMLLKVARNGIVNIQVSQI